MADKWSASVQRPQFERIGGPSPSSLRSWASTPEALTRSRRVDRTLLRRASWLAPCTGLLLGCLAANALIGIGVGIMRVSHSSPSTRHSRYLWSKCLAS